MALSHLGLLGKICLQVLYSRWWLKPNLWWHSRTPQRSLQSFQTSQSIPSKGGSCRIGTTSNCFGIKHLRAWAYKVMCMSAHGSLLNLPVYRKSKESGKQKSRSSRMTPSSLSLSLALSLFLPPPSQTTLEPIVALLIRYSMPAFYLALNTCTSLFSLGMGTGMAIHTGTLACSRHPPS